MHRKLELNPDAWSRNPSLRPSWDWHELFTDFLPSFSGSVEPSHSHCAENIPDSWENRPEGPHRHHLNGGKITHQGQRVRSAGDTSLMPSCYLFVPLMTLKKKNDLLVVRGWVGVGGGKKICFVWVLVSFCNATGSSVVCESHTAFRYLCFVTRGNLPFWERISGPGAVRVSVHHWCQVKEGSGIAERTKPEVSWP